MLGEASSRHRRFTSRSSVDGPVDRSVTSRSSVSRTIGSVGKRSRVLGWSVVIRSDRSTSAASSSAPARIGTWWLRGVEALSGERPLWSVLATRLRPQNGVASGKLFLTTQRIVFCPHRLDDAVVGGSWAIERRLIQAVSVEPPRPAPVVGLPGRSTVTVSIDATTVERFLVLAPKRVARRFNELLLGIRHSRARWRVRHE